jgi:hypothetical protein
VVCNYSFNNDNNYSVTTSHVSRIMTRIGFGGSKFPVDEDRDGS